MLRCLLYMFRTVTVHPQELPFRCCMCRLWYVVRNALSGTSRWYSVALLCSSSFTLITAGRIETYQIATYSIRTLLKMDNCSPKHVELLNVMNKINHQILCILLDYIYIAK